MNSNNFINDCVSDNDYLGYLPYIEAFEYLICNHSSLMSLPVVFGIHGKWGVGKSTFMYLIKKKLDDAKNKNGTNSFFTLELNPWEYGSDQNFISIFLAKLYEVAKVELSSQEKGEDDYITRVFKSLLRPLKLSANAGIFKADYDLSKLSFQAKKTIIDDFISENFSMKEIIKSILNSEIFENRKIVVFIDDLDRCRSDKVMEVIESIKLVLDSKNCIFFLGCDKDYLENALSIKYKEFIEFTEKSEDGNNEKNNYKRNLREFAREYLEKIIQVPFGIPPLNNESIESYIDCVLFKKNRNSTSRVIIAEDLSKKFNENVSIKLISNLIVKAELNPRKIKRTLNLLFLNYIFIFFKFNNNENIIKNINIDILSILGFIRDVEQEYYKKYLSKVDNCKNTLLSFYSFFHDKKEQTENEYSEQSFMQNQYVKEYFKIFFNYAKITSKQVFLEKLENIEVYISVSNTTTYEDYTEINWGSVGEHRSEITGKKLKEFLNRLRNDQLALDFVIWLFENIYNDKFFVFGLQSNIHFYKKSDNELKIFLFRLEYNDKEKSLYIKFDRSNTYKSIFLDKEGQFLSTIKSYNKSRKQIEITNTLDYKSISQIKKLLEGLITNCI